MSSPAPSVTGELPTKAGILRATIVPGAGRNQIQSVTFSGIRAEPAGVLARLEQTLGGSTIDEAPGKIEDFFAQNPKALPGIEPEEFLTVMTLAFMKVRRTTSTAPDPGGEVAVIDVALVTVNVLAAVPPKLTAVAPYRAVPEMVTTAPPCGAPHFVSRPETEGAAAATEMGLLTSAVAPVGPSMPTVKV